MLKTVRRALGRELRRRGIYWLGPEPFGVINRELLLRRYGITVVFDAGANVGQYGKQLRYIGYSGRIISFEPSSGAYTALQQASGGDRLWEVHKLAVGNEEGEKLFNIANSTVCNSFLPMLDSYKVHVPGTEILGQETVGVCRLDGFLGSVFPEDRVWVKLDVEGHELAAIAGAQKLLARVDLVEIEMATERLLEGEPLFFEVAPALYKLGFRLISVSPAYKAPSGRTLKFDGAFGRPKPLKNRELIG